MLAIRQGRWKLIAEGVAPGAAKQSPWTAEGKKQLYHLGDDPKETTNVLEKNPEVAARLGQLLEAYRERGYSRPMKP